MFASFLLALREGLEVALILGLLLSALRRLGHGAMAKYVWLGAGSALAVSATGGGTLTILGIRLMGQAEAIFEGLTMLIAAAVLTWAILWMQQHGKRLQEYLAAQIPHAAKAGKTALFLLAFVVAGREGLELALFLTAAIVSTGDSGGVLGGAVTGLGAAALIGWGLYTSTVRLNLRAFFLATSILLLLFAAGLTAHGVHELIEAGWIPPLQESVWNVNHIIDENSPAGQLLKTLFGYNGNPALSEVLAYWLYLTATGLGMYKIRKGAQDLGYRQA